MSRRKRRKEKAMPQCGRIRDLCPALVMSKKLTTGTKGEALCRIEHLRDGWEELRMESKVMRTWEAAKYIGVSPWKLRNLVHEGRLAYLSDGDSTSALRFLVEDMDDYLTRCRVPATPDFSASAA
jgi:excisionase family DNA binding protein